MGIALYGTVKAKTVHFGEAREEKKPDFSNNRNGAKDGFALLSVLVILAILTPLVVNLSYSTRVQLTGADYLACKIKSREIARAGLESAILSLKKDNRNYDGYTEEWGEFEDLSHFSGSFFEDGHFEGVIEDEEGKINLNNLISASALDARVENQLTLLLEQLGKNIDLVDAVIDWIDEDDDPELAGAESDYYTGLDEPYSPKNGPMDNIYELRLIKGITDDIFFGKENEAGLTSFVTSYGDRLVNINTAPAEVIASLSELIDAALADEIVAYRRDEPFKSIGELKKVTGIDSDIYDAVRNMIKVKSSYFSISVKGYSKDVYTDINAFVNRDGDTIKLIYYSEV